ncbi:hypothetical protein JAAARDRAFT_170871 [Jaapia argillacea MUCL 33604]|uniref:NAD(P)-binding protein n=1 Tax=Jaapia argillacea MUCL 33604 TaxID=933084 RepID=A0A067QG59_9AGAM|nr:hypothetical protein JAAARDRAFT_170871 [Jaapia argillacea MUCL 33604]
MGTIRAQLHLLSQSFPPKSKFSVDDIPDLSGKVIIVTGANTGIGKETAQTLLSHNAKVYVACRSQEKAEQAIKDLKVATGKDAEFLKLDLADLKAIKASVEEFTSKEKELHVLFNNGGVMMCPVDMTTADGYDLQFGTNVLGHWYLSKLLLPTLLETAITTPEGKVRIINTSSSMHAFGDLNFKTFKDGPERTKVATRNLYAQSKFGNVVVSNELARRYGEQGIVSISLNPGNIKTDLARYMSGMERTFINKILYPAPFGALTQLYAGTMPECLEMNGKYLVPWARLGPPKPSSDDPRLGERLWSWLEEQVKGL